MFSIYNPLEQNDKSIVFSVKEFKNFPVTSYKSIRKSPETPWISITSELGLGITFNGSEQASCILG